MQLINSIPLNLRNIIKNNCSSINLLLLNHHLVKNNDLISLDKLYFREFIFLRIDQPLTFTLKICFENKIYTGRKFTYFREKYC